MDRVPVVLVGGFLGAGKTTLLNHLLKQLPASAVAAVILHKFALEFELETVKVELHDRVAFFREVFDFGTGCICCSPKGDFARALWDLVAENETRAQDGKPPITHLFVKTTGLAEPAVFARVFFQDDSAVQHFCLHKPLCVLDPHAIGPHLAEQPPPGLTNKAQSQLSIAGWAVLNSRLPDDTGLESVVDTLRLQQHAPHAELVPSIAGVRLSHILADSKTAQANAISGLEDAGSATLTFPGISFAEARLSHDKRVESTCLVEESSIVWDHLRVFLDHLAQELSKGNLFRVKGVVHIRNDSIAGCLPELALGQGAQLVWGQSRLDQHHPQHNFERGGWVVVDGTSGALYVWAEKVPPRTQMYNTAPLHALGSGGVQDKDLSCGEAECSITHATHDVANTSKVFLVGRGVDVSDMRRRLHKCAVPRGYVHVADLDIEFASNACSARTSNMSGIPYKLLKCEIQGEEEREELILVKMGNEFCAMERWCPHAGADLAEGDIEDFGEGVGKLVACPAHMFTFSMETGKCVTTPSCPRSKVFPVEVISGSVYVGTNPKFDKFAL